MTLNKNETVCYDNYGGYGGAVFCKSSSPITTDCNSNTAFHNNKVKDDERAIHSNNSSHIKFIGFS